MNHVDLCSGIGGFALGFQWAGLSKPVMFCDVEPWCRKVLAKHWPDVPIEEDVKVLANEPERIPECTILTAGYPCQPFSLAGERRGAEDDRHIWPYISQIIERKRPAWCVFENVYGHLSMGLDEVLLDLEGQGYATRPFIVPACGVDAPHKRDRIWIIARNVGDTKCSRQSRDDRGQSGKEPKNRRENVANSSRIVSNGRGHKQLTEKRQRQGQFGRSGSTYNVAYTESKRIQGLRPSGEQELRSHEGQKIPMCGGEGRGQTVWLPEPAVGRVANGIPRRVDRLRGLGNAIVPQIAMQIGLSIKEVQG